MYKFPFIKRPKKQVFKVSFVVAAIIVAVSAKVGSTEMTVRADEVIKDPIGCTFLTQATRKDQNLYLFYECRERTQKARKYFLLRRHLNGNDFDDLIFPWHFSQPNAFVFGSCKLREPAHTSVNAILPGEGKNRVPINEVTAAWQINSSTGRMEEVSKKQLSVCYEPGFEQ